jgi:AcrR family transcriptional regulator
VLDAATAPFAQRGVDAVSLRDIAAAAGVHVSLISRYVGYRDELVAEVFRPVSDQVARAVEENPLAGQGFSPDAVMGKWARIAAALAFSGRFPESHRDFNPVAAMAHTLMAGYGMAEEAARLRAAQIAAAALGWRIFEAYLVEAGRAGRRPAGGAAGRARPVCAPARRHARALAARPPATHALIQPAALPGTPVPPNVGTFGPSQLRTWGDVQ